MNNVLKQYINRTQKDFSDGTDKQEIIAMRYNHYVKRIHTTLVSILAEREKIIKRSKQVAALKSNPGDMEDDQSGERSVGGSYERQRDDSMIQREGSSVFMTIANVGTKVTSVNTSSHSPKAHNKGTGADARDEPGDDEYEEDEDDYAGVNTERLEAYPAKDQRYVLEVFYFLKRSIIETHKI